MKAVEVKNLTKIFKTGKNGAYVTALKDFSISVDTGTIYGLLGPNGAGKTTFVKILLGITFPTEGAAKILDQDISKVSVRARTGYLPENHKFPQYLTGGDVLKYIAELNGLQPASIEQRIDELLNLVKMKKWKNVKLKKYSKGMMQRLGLAQALINDPDLIFLDEPTDGVDPIGRKEIRDILADLKQKGKTIFVNSHLLSEVEMISDKVAILNEGVLVKEGTVEEMTIEGEGHKFVIDRVVDENVLSNILSNFDISIDSMDSFSVRISESNDLNKILDILRKNEIGIKSMSQVKHTLEDLFIEVIHDSEGAEK